MGHDAWEESLCTFDSGDGGHTCSGVIHISLVALLWRILALSHVVTGVVAEGRYKEAAHPQREWNAVCTTAYQPTEASSILIWTNAFNCMSMPEALHSISHAVHHGSESDGLERDEWESTAFSPAAKHVVGIWALDVREERHKNRCGKIDAGPSEQPPSPLLVCHKCHPC